MLEIHLLGSIELRRDGELVRLGGGRQRRLLAFLALQPGRVRTVDSICAALWPDGDLPADPHQTVRTYASRLRSSLGEPQAITMRDGGYELSVDGVLIDAMRFQALMSTANDPSRPSEESVELLDQALSLWAGPALDGFELEDWARPDAVQLEELRAQAIDDRAEAQLELGLPDEAVAALRAGVAANPLRERTHRLLMVALHQSGRQAEALRAYQDYRRRLATDLGLEPGNKIRQLEVAIATGELPPDAVRRRLLPKVAMKITRPALADRADFVRRSEAEAQLVARLERPDVVPLYAYWREPGAAYLLMRLPLGGTLEHRLALRRSAHGKPPG